MKKKNNPFGMKVPSKKPMSTRNVVKRHLKEWNFDDEEDENESLNVTIEDIKDKEEYFLGPDPRKHKDFKHFSGN